MRNLFKSLFSCFVFMVFIHQNAFNQNYEKLNGPYGGGAKVYEGKNGQLYQFLSEDQLNIIIYKSSNGGTSWSKLPTPPAKQILDPLEVGMDGNLYCAKNDKLYRSVNDGLSWNAVNSPTNETVKNFTALPNGTFLVSQADMIFLSNDNGMNWNAIPISGVHSFSFNSYTQHIYAIGSNTLYMSDDFGISWSVFYSDDFGYGKKYIISSSNGFVFIAGLGSIWKLDTSGVFIRKTNLVTGLDKDVNITLATSGKMFADESNHSFYSTNYGESWIKFTATSNDPNIFNYFSAISNGDVFGVHVSGSLFRSTNNGISWNFAANGMNHASVLELKFISERNILALSVDGLFYSSDAGQNWKFMHKSSLSQNNNPGTKRVVHIGNEILFSDKSDIYYFKDANSSGIKYRTKMANSPSDKLVYNIKTNSVFSIEANNMFRSTDKGVNWSTVNLSDAEDLHAFADGSMIATKKDGVFSSIDNGENWTQVISYAATDNNRILSDGFSTVYIFYYELGWKIRRSIDKGLSWERIIVRDPNSFVIEPINGQACNNLGNLFSVGLTNEIFWSQDNGSNFSVFLDGIPDVANLEVSPQQKLYIATINKGLYRTFSFTTAVRILTGNVFSDVNKNCTKEPNEIHLSKRLIKASNGNRTIHAYSDGYGDFRLPLEQGVYLIEEISANNAWASCTANINTSTFNFNDTVFIGLQANSLCPLLNVSIQTSILRRCTESVLYIDYSNTGTQKANNAYVDITLDPLFEFISSSLPVNSQNGNVYRFLLGDVDLNGSGYFTIKVNVSCMATMGQTHCAEAHIYPDTSCIQSSVALVRTSANCLGDSIELIIKNEGSKDMSVAKKWSVIDLSTANTSLLTFDNGFFKLDAGQTFTKRIASKERVLFIAEQDDSYPYSKNSRTEIISCVQFPTPGMPPLRISNLDESEPYLSKFCEQNRGSFDPNDITGYPIGLTDKKYIDNRQILEYIIRFQNTGTDTAFNIRIENTIPLKELDLSTLSLGASSHPYKITMTPEAKLIFTFSNILLPDSSINEKESHGFISYTIQAIDPLVIGTKIFNEAFIYFDFNDAIKTNKDFHTLGIPIPVKVHDSKEVDEINFQLSPNPVKESAVLHLFTKERNKDYLLACYDVNAKYVWEKTIRSNQTIISKADLKSGVYLLVLKSKDGRTLKSGKMIIE